MSALALAALLCATLFTGAAAYISLVEHPARLSLEDAPLLAQWQPSYKRALPLQSGLALAGGLAGLIAWWLWGDWKWLAASLLLLANWPFTLLVILPVTKRLLALNPAQAGAESRAMLLRWGKLHAVRSLLGCGSTVLFAWACLTAG